MCNIKSTKVKCANFFRQTVEWLIVQSGLFKFEFPATFLNFYFVRIFIFESNWLTSLLFTICMACLKTFFCESNGILLPKMFWPTVRENCFSDWEKLLKFEAEGPEFAKNLRSLEQFIRGVKGQNNVW